MNSSPNSTNTQEDTTQLLFDAPNSDNSLPVTTNLVGDDKDNKLPGTTKTAKRRQVKNACVNCQRACKKCDDGRPCQRCMNYNLTETCRNSVRKERKKGVKRGPYNKIQQKIVVAKISKKDKKSIDDKSTSSSITTNDKAVLYGHTGILAKQQITTPLLHEPSYNNNTTSTAPSLVGRYGNSSLKTMAATTSTIPTFQLHQQQQPILNEPLDAYLSLYNDNQLYQALQIYTAASLMD